MLPLSAVKPLCLLSCPGAVVFHSLTFAVSLQSFFFFPLFTILTIPVLPPLRHFLTPAHLSLSSAKWLVSVSAECCVGTVHSTLVKTRQKGETNSKPPTKWAGRGDRSFTDSSCSAPLVLVVLLFIFASHTHRVGIFKNSYTYELRQMIVDGTISQLKWANATMLGSCYNRIIVYGFKVYAESHTFTFHRWISAVSH